MASALVEYSSTDSEESQSETEESNSEVDRSKSDDEVLSSDDEPVGTATAPKRKLKSYTAAQKLEVIQYVEKHGIRPA